MPHHGGANIPYNGVLHHFNAYTGYDAAKERFANYFLLNPDTENADFLAAIDYLATTYGGGTLGADGPIPIDTANFDVPGLTTDLIITGNGHRKGAGTLANARECRTYFEFQNGFRIVNTHASENNGRLIFRDLGLIWNGLVNNPGFDTEFQPFGIENCLITGFNNIVTNYTDALIGCTATPAPEAGMSWIIDSDIALHNNNNVGIFVHKEMMYLDNTIISFNANNQVGWMVTHPELPPGRGFNVVGHLEIWMGAGAEGCAVFQAFNAAKCVGIDSIVTATQAGAGATTANVICGLRAGQPWVTLVPAYVVTKGIDGPFLWGQAPAVGNYLWEDGDAQERTRFVSGATFGGETVPGPQIKTFICDGTYETTGVGPGVAPGQPFNVNLARDVDLGLVIQVRVTGRGIGDQAAGAKGVVIYNIDDATILCTSGDWAGNAVNQFEGPWVNVPLTAAGWRNCNAYGYSNNGGEDMSASIVELELR